MKKQIVIGGGVIISLLFTANLFAGYWTYRPMSVNAKQGDIILSAEAGMTEDIVKTVSGYWEHAGMVIDDGFTIRHNTKYLDAMGIDYNYINLFFTRIKTTPRRLNPDQLANGMPGMITEDVNTAVNGEHARFHIAGGILIAFLRRKRGLLPPGAPARGGQDEVPGRLLPDQRLRKPVPAVRRELPRQGPRQHVLLGGLVRELLFR